MIIATNILVRGFNYGYIAIIIGIKLASFCQVIKIITHREQQSLSFKFVRCTVLSSSLHIILLPLTVKA